MSVTAKRPGNVVIVLLRRDLFYWSPCYDTNKEENDQFLCLAATRGRYK
jgi:hypothetical protein